MSSRWILGLGFLAVLFVPAVRADFYGDVCACGTDTACVNDVIDVACASGSAPGSEEICYACKPVDYGNCLPTTTAFVATCPTECAENPAVAAAGASCQDLVAQQSCEMNIATIAKIVYGLDLPNPTYLKDVCPIACDSCPGAPTSALTTTGEMPCTDDSRIADSGMVTCAGVEASLTCTGNVATYAAALLGLTLPDPTLVQEVCPVTCDYCDGWTGPVTLSTDAPTQAPIPGVTNAPTPSTDAPTQAPIPGVTAAPSSDAPTQAPIPGVTNAPTASGSSEAPTPANNSGDPGGGDGGDGAAETATAADVVTASQGLSGTIASLPISNVDAQENQDGTVQVSFTLDTDLAALDESTKDSIQADLAAQLGVPESAVTIAYEEDATSGSVIATATVTIDSTTDTTGDDDDDDDVTVATVDDVVDAAEDLEGTSLASLPIVSDVATTDLGGTVQVSFTLDIDVTALDDSTKASIEADLATELGVPESTITVTYEDDASGGVLLTAIVTTAAAAIPVFVVNQNAEFVRLTITFGDVDEVTVQMVEDLVTDFCAAASLSTEVCVMITLDLEAAATQYIGMDVRSTGREVTIVFNVVHDDNLNEGLEDLVLTLYQKLYAGDFGDVETKLLLTHIDWSTVTIEVEPLVSCEGVKVIKCDKAPPISLSGDQRSAVVGMIAMCVTVLVAIYQF